MKIVKITREIKKALYSVYYKISDFIVDTLSILDEILDIEEISSNDHHPVNQDKKIE